MLVFYPDRWRFLVWFGSGPTSGRNYVYFKNGAGGVPTVLRTYAHATVDYLKTHSTIEEVA